LGALGAGGKPSFWRKLIANLQAGPGDKSCLENQGLLWHFADECAPLHPTTSPLLSASVPIPERSKQEVSQAVQGRGLWVEGAVLVGPLALFSHLERRVQGVVPSGPASWLSSRSVTDSHRKKEHKNITCIETCLLV
jgi:hypothetical protein